MPPLGFLNKKDPGLEPRATLPGIKTICSSPGTARKLAAAPTDGNEFQFHISAPAVSLVDFGLSCVWAKFLPGNEPGIEVQLGPACFSTLANASKRRLLQTEQVRNSTAIGVEPLSTGSLIVPAEAALRRSMLLLPNLVSVRPHADRVETGVRQVQKTGTARRAQADRIRLPNTHS